MNWLLFWLFLHITAAVIAFGPTFVFPLVGTLARRHPEHMSFALEVNHTIETRLVAPLALSMLVSGVGLIFSANVNVLRSTFLWIAILLYLAAIAIAFGVAIPTTSKLVALTRNAASGGVPEGSPTVILALIKRVQMAGGALTILFLTIIFLMIVQPGGLVPGPIFG